MSASGLSWLSILSFAKAWNFFGSTQICRNWFLAELWHLNVFETLPYLCIVVCDHIKPWNVGVDAEHFFGTVVTAIVWGSRTGSISLTQVKSFTPNVWPLWAFLFQEHVPGDSGDLGNKQAHQLAYQAATNATGAGHQEHGNYADFWGSIRDDWPVSVVISSDSSFLVTCVMCVFLT